MGVEARVVLEERSAPSVEQLQSAVRQLVGQQAAGKADCLGKALRAPTFADPDAAEKK